MPIKKTLGLLSAVVLTGALVVFWFFPSGWRTRHLGQNLTQTLPCGEKVLGVNWANNSYWILSKPALPGEPMLTLKYREYAARGVLNAQITIVEHACSGNEKQ